MHPVNRAPGFFDNLKNAESRKKSPKFDPEAKSIRSYQSHKGDSSSKYFRSKVYDFPQAYPVEYKGSEEFPSLMISRPPGFDSEDFCPPPGFSKPNRAKGPNPNAVSFIPSYLSGPSFNDDKEETESLEYGLRGVASLQQSLSEEKKMIFKGMDLGYAESHSSEESISRTFASPFTEKSLDENESPEFTLPSSYYVSKPILKAKMIKSFILETLFYVFYSMPGELIQNFVADELYRREWLFEPVAKNWFFNNDGDWKTFDINKFEIVQTSPNCGPFLNKNDISVKQRALA